MHVLGLDENSSPQQLPTVTTNSSFTGSIRIHETPLSAGNDKISI